MVISPSPFVLDVLHHEVPEVFVKAHTPEDVTVTDRVSASPEKLSSVGLTESCPSINCLLQPARSRPATNIKYNIFFIIWIT
jgi:hypothetical protein